MSGCRRVGGAVAGAAGVGQLALVLLGHGLVTVGGEARRGTDAVSRATRHVEVYGDFSRVSGHPDNVSARGPTFFARSQDGALSSMHRA